MPVAIRSLPKNRIVPDVFFIVYFFEVAIFFYMEETFRVFLNVIYKYYAVGVVDLVLEYARQEALGSNAEVPAVLILGTHPDFCMTRYLAIDIGDAKAALKILFNFTLVFGNFRINKNCKSLVFSVV